MKDYYFIHEYVGVIPQQDGFNWIWWCPGNKTEEGWEPYPEKVSAKREGMPSHYLRNGEEIATDLQTTWLDQWLNLRSSKKVATLKNEDLLDHIHCDLGKRLSQAMLLSKFVASYISPSTIVNFFRHRASSYESALREGGDYLTHTIRVHRELVEIMGVYRNHKDAILTSFSADFEYHKKLALLDHDKIIGEALSQINKKRLQE